MAAATVGHRLAPRHLVGYGALVFGILDLALFLYPLVIHAWWPAPLFMLAVGLPGALVLAGLLTLFQTNTSDAYRGRIFGAYSAVQPPPCSPAPSPPASSATASASSPSSPSKAPDTASLAPSSSYSYQPTKKTRPPHQR